MDWFGRYCFPVSDDVQGVWAVEPSKWRPINHACSANTALASPHLLDTKTTRRVKMGEELSLDYATFCGLRMQTFPCGCGHNDCRKTIQGDDFLRPHLAEKWGGHVSAALHGQQKRHKDGTKMTLFFFFCLFLLFLFCV